MDVILLKSAYDDPYSSGADPYLTLLRSHDVPADLIETMSFTICGCLFERLCKWRSLYSCIIFCSRRAVSSFASTNLIGLPEDLCFVVGPATSAAARKLGFHTKGSHTGNAENLANFVLENYFDEVSKKPVLLLTGTKHNPALPNKFREAGLAVDELVVYNSLLNPYFGEQLSLALKSQKNRLQVLVFFSPSGVELARPILSEFLSCPNSIRIIAIGPTTASKIEELHLPLASSCQSPTPDSLLECLMNEITH